MKALTFDGSSIYWDADYPRPRPLPGEALIRVLLAGFCATDLEITRGYRKFRGVLGHELVGMVEEVNGPGHQFLGRRVVGEINLGCGGCSFCRQGQAGHCPDRRVAGILGKDGAFAEYLTLPVDNLHLVPDQVADEAAVFAEPLAAAMQVPEQIHLRPSDRLLVMGDGKLGLLIAQVLRLAGPQLILLGHHPDKLALAAAQGIATILAPDLAQEPAFDVVVEATGSAAGLGQALALLRPRGTLVLKSTVAAFHEIDLSPVVVKEINVTGSRCGPFPPALRALAAGRVEVLPLISRIYRADQALEAFAHAAARGALKVLLDFRPS